MRAPWKKSYDKSRQHAEKQRYHLANKGPYSQNYGFSSSHLWMWEVDHKEGWAPKNWCFQTAVLENTLESPLDSKEIKPVDSKGNQPWIFIGKTDAKAEAPILWPTHWKRLWCWKRLRAGRGRDDRGWMAGWHHQLNGHESEQTLGDSEGQEVWCATVHGVANSQTWLSD